MAAPKRTPSHGADAWRYLASSWRELMGLDEDKDPFADLLKKPTLNDWLTDLGDMENELGITPEALFH